ncbi:hypothetical protein FQN60_015233 [Etheostoma spectabile]|uniref:Unspecific monooxygenase n=1 Tax=Etheostoma spectabile TaxID=54343 RepID=A0A5J5CUN8_9PERO|nr:hypothetical protein FQN60_015233 [Etheostoma spectabile]
MLRCSGINEFTRAVGLHSMDRLHAGWMHGRQPAHLTPSISPAFYMAEQFWKTNKLMIPIMDWTLDVMNPTNARALLLACVTLLFSLHLWRWLRQRAIACPPGPLGWPLIGNASQMGNAPHLYFTRMAKKYGNVFQIKLGSLSVVVLNGDSIKAALVNQGYDFAGRPNFTSFKYISNGASIAFGTMTDWWKIHRKVAQSTIRMFSNGNPITKKTFEHHVLCETKEMLQLFVEKTKEHIYFQPMTYLVVSQANIMSAVCFGKRYSYEDEEFRQVVGRNDQFTQTVGAGSLVDVMPWLQYFPNPIKTVFDNFKELNREFSEFIGNKVNEHRKTIQPSIIRDMTDAFIVALDHLRDKAGLSLGKDDVTPAMVDIFGASQDTLSTALQWIVILLVKYPEIQVRLQQEVDKVVGRSRLPPSRTSCSCLTSWPSSTRCCATPAFCRSPSPTPPPRTPPSWATAYQRTQSSSSTSGPSTTTLPSGPTRRTLTRSVSWTRTER